MAPPLFGSRTILDEKENEQISKKFLHLFKKEITTTKIMDISSTYVRERLSKGLYCGHLVNAKVLEYISAHNLY